jgi:hypothetical protein
MELNHEADGGRRDGGGPASTCAIGADLSILTPIAQGAYSTLVSADLNGDGMLDLVAGAEASHFLGFSVFLGQSDGGLGLPTNYTFDPLVCNRTGDGIAIGDLNGDGFPDVVVSCDYFFYVFMNDGTGALTAPIQYSTNAGWVLGLAIGDVNGDGRPDVVAGGSTRPAELFLNIDGGVLGQPIEVSDPVFGGWGWLAATDLNGDGLADIAVCASNLQLLVLLSRDDGGFDTGSYASCSGEILPVLETSPSNLLVALSNAVAVFTNSGHGALTISPSYPTGSGGPWIAEADFNADGILDLAVSGHGYCVSGPLDGGLSVLFGNGEGGFGTAVPLRSGGPSPAGLAPLGLVACPRALAVADACGQGISVLGDASRH